MKFEKNLIQGKFLKRLNRFTVLVQIDSREVKAHLANSGRLREILIPGHTALLAPVESEKRKTKYDLCLIQTESKAWISTDARLPNKLFHEAFSSHALKPFLKYDKIQPEVTFGQSRLDFQLKNASESCFVEVKSITLVEHGIGYFPDAPTERGRKHLKELLKIKKEGHRAAAVFVVQRNDAQSVKPHDDADPEFGETLQNVFNQGVEVYAYRCQVDPQEIVIHDEIPVRIEALQC